ncbi:MAG TPA: sialidase family protein [Candidatus Koribacter sp.]|jgi:hypothetical protein
MTRSARRFAIASLAVAGFLTIFPLAAIAGDSATQGAPQVKVGPNMLVSRDGDFSHAELGVAVSPRNPKNIISAAITASRGEGGFACKTYASTDGGSSWTDSSFREQLEFGGGDPQVAFGLHGTAYFTSLAFVKDEKGNERGGLFFYRSEDGGKTWQKPADLAWSWDHEVMTVDHSYGKYSGRVYISVLWGYPEYKLGIFRSDDDGRTFTGPVEAASGKSVVGINTSKNIVLLSDGTLVLPYDDFEFDEKRAENAHSSNMWLVTSSDGGVTFSQPVKVGSLEYNRSKTGEGFQTMAAMAVDLSDKFKDRLYSTWTDYRTGAYRLWFASSKDRGLTWSEPRQILGDLPTWASQYQPELAVNNDGVLGISWLDTRNSPNHDSKHYDEYFAASLDGGETFTAATRISDQTSTRTGKGNMALQASMSELEIPGGEPQTRVGFISGVSRWPAGGDYLQLATDSNGVFHPIWADARSGTFQVETAAVSVVQVPQREAGIKEPGLASPAAKRDLPQNVETLLEKKVELVFDPLSYDEVNNVLTVPTRLRNISSTTIYGPITLEVLKFGSGMGDLLKEYSPSILNAGNHKNGTGATFDYTLALGSDQYLEPGALSGEVVWQLKVQDPLRIPDVHIAVKGMIPQVK